MATDLLQATESELDFSPKEFSEFVSRIRRIVAVLDEPSGICTVQAGDMNQKNPEVLIFLEFSCVCGEPVKCETGVHLSESRRMEDDLSLQKQIGYRLQGAVRRSTMHRQRIVMEPCIRNGN